MRARPGPAPAAGLSVRQFALPAVVAAVLRMALILAAFARTGTAVMTQGDTASYLAPMMGLLRHGSYASHVAGSWVPELDRTPGFPLFLLGTGMAGGHVLVCLLCQVAVSLLSLVLVGKIAGRVFASPWAGVMAAWFYALEPLSIVSSARVMPETLFVLLLLCVLERLTAYLEDGRLMAVAWAGLALAAATFVRPVSYFLVWPLALGLLLVGPYWVKPDQIEPDEIKPDTIEPDTIEPDRAESGRFAGRFGPLSRPVWRRLTAVFLLVVMVEPWFAAWRLRNSAVAGYSGFSTIVEKNLYFYQTAELRAELAGISLEQEQSLLGYPDEAAYLARHPEQRDWPLVQRLTFMRAESLAVLREHRLLYLKTHLRGMLVVAFSPGATEFLQLVGAYPDTPSMPRRVVNEGLLASGLRLVRTHAGMAAGMAVFALPLVFLYGAAVIGLLRGRTRLVLLVAGVGAYFLVISGGAQAVGRYRVPVMPELCVLAAGVSSRGRPLTA